MVLSSKPETLAKMWDVQHSSFLNFSANDDPRADSTFQIQKTKTIYNL